MKKSVIAILMTTVILLSLIIPMLSFPVQAAVTSEYGTVSSVLNTDSYVLYPYSTSKNLQIGFSKYGEMINNDDNVGLEYGVVDPFAPPAGSAIASIVKSAWLNGWLCNITYYHNERLQNRTVWASAQFGDPNGPTYAGSWIRVDFPNDYNVTYGAEDPRDPGYIIGNYAAGSDNYGGRKTNGTAVTQPIQVLYDGPRSFVALLRTTVYDHFVNGDVTGQDIPLLEVRLTIMFDKVKKEVVVLKELKTLVIDKYADELKVQFSNRGEVDLGVEDTGYTSYFHFYTQGTSANNPYFNDEEVKGQPTVYNSSYVLNTTENPSNTNYPWYSAAGPYPQDSSATYDLAVAINPTVNYTWWAAFWPSLSDWSIDGWPMWYRSMGANDTHDIDSRTWQSPSRTEPTIPYYIGEWDVVLKSKGKLIQQQYRFVTVYGITDLNDGNDAQMNAQIGNRIDRETMYQLNETFNPWDLYSAVEKTTKSWVEWKTATGTTYTTVRRPVLLVANSSWDQYNVFSERVIDLTTGALLKRIKYVGDQQLPGDYNMVLNADGTATISGLTSARTYKILYNTLPDNSSTRTTTISTIYTSTTNATSYDVPARSLNDSWTDWIGAGHGFKVTFDAFTVYANLASGTTGNWTYTWTLPTKKWDETNFKVFAGETYNSSMLDILEPINVTLRTPSDSTTFNATFTFDIDRLEKNLTATSDPTVIYPLPKETIHAVYLNHTLGVTVTVKNTNVTDATSPTSTNSTLTVTFATIMTTAWRDMIPGRYEWTTVGRDAQTVDAAGAALVTAAFKNKQVEIGLSSADMFSPLDASGNANLQMPWVMSNFTFTTGNPRANYYKSGTDYRTALRDDWCKAGTVSGDEWPVASSNMIGVGGPYANLLAFYGNDFTDAFFGLSDFTSYTAWAGKIVPKTCWNHTQAYASSNTVGYAVISTYQDINGTVLFLIWGHWGRDTYYATKWFHEEGIYELQRAPAGVTSIIVKITYESTSEGYKPTGWSIPEVLGTISERQWIDGLITKGGIHDP